MESNSRSEQVIQKYREDETLMIRLFVQWCANHGLDPHRLYLAAYPGQAKNPALQDAIDADEGMEELAIDDETMLDVLQLFGNEDLAFVVADEIARLPKSD